jgi:UDP-N-acetylglucosamine acyltransferase
MNSPSVMVDFYFLQVIGDNNLVMGSCHIAHDCKLGNHNILANGTLIGGHVILEVNLPP